MQQACRHAIEEVENGTNDDKQQRKAEVASGGPHNGNASRDEVAAGDGVGNML